jgi:hypothetical protein
VERDTYVFVGPTLPVEAARAILPATYLPPVAQGDVLRLLSKRPAAIGIIDGYFERVPSVWHKELLLALERGVALFGAASMGALRAAELHSFGMVGVGAIFEAYRSGELEDDDEVALVHGPAEDGYRAHSTAMVDLRDLFARAAAAGVISAAIAAELVALAKAQFYAERSLRAVLALGRRAGLDAETLARLQEWSSRQGPSAKARDAQLLLATMAARADVAPQRAAFTVERTVFLEALELEVRGCGADEAAAGGDSPQDGAPSAIDDRALLAILAQRELDRFGRPIGTAERRHAVDEFRRRFALTDVEELDRRLGAVGIDLEAFVARVVDLAAIDRARRIHAFEHARAASEHAALAKLAADHVD